VVQDTEKAGKLAHVIGSGGASHVGTFVYSRNKLSTPLQLRSLNCLAQNWAGHHITMNL
jgi:hypothetical protein